MDKLLVEIKVTGYNIVRDEILEIFIMNLGSKEQYRKSYYSGIKMEMEMELYNGITNKSMLRREGELIKFEDENELNRIFEILNNNILVGYNMGLMRAIMTQKFAKSEKIFGLNTIFFDVRDYKILREKNSFIDNANEILNKDYVYMSNLKEKSIVTAKIFEKYSGYKLSELCDKELNNILEECENNNKIVYKIDTQGKIIYNKFTKRYLIMFGKYYGMEVSKIPDDYIDWILRDNNTSIEIKSIIKKLITKN